MGIYNLTSLTEKEFENLTFDLLCELGLKNCVWRTPGRDVGRDIEGDYFFTDVSGYCQKQKWYVECKRYTSSVDWPTVWNKISYAEAHNADVLLFSLTSSLSPQAIDQVSIWNKNNKRPIIRVFNAANISNKLRLFPQLAIRYGLIPPTEANISLSLFPLVQLLLKTIYSLSSGLAVGVDITTKAELTQAITDLISVRICDYKKEGKIQSYKYIDHEDRYNWVENSKCIENTNFDRYGIRAVISYVKLQSKSPSLNIIKDTQDRLVIENCMPDDKQKEQLLTISYWSNFNIQYSGKNIILEGY